jgi:hypothetical protein
MRVTRELDDQATLLPYLDAAALRQLPCLSDGFIVIAAFHDDRLLGDRPVALKLVQAVIGHNQPQQGRS